MTTTRGSKAKLAAVKDVDVLDPQPNVVMLESGAQVEIVPLKSRQFFKLLRIITHGAGDAVQALRLDPNDSDGAFIAKMVGTILFSIPEAENEAIDFVVSMVKPVGLIEGRKLDEEAKERNIELWAKVLDEFDNPSMDDMVSIIEKIIENEAPNLKALGKRLMTMFEATMGKKDQETKTTPGSTSTE